MDRRHRQPLYAGILSGHQIEDQRRRHLRPVVSQLFDVAGRLPHGFSHLRRGVSPCFAVEHERKRLPPHRQQDRAEIRLSGGQRNLRQQRDAAIGSRVSRPVRCLCGAGILPDESRRLSGVFQGRDRSIPTTARELEFSAPKNLRRVDHRAQPQDHDAVSYRQPALAENTARLPVPQAMHHFYMAQSYAGERFAQPGIERTRGGDSPRAEESRNFTCSK